MNFKKILQISALSLGMPLFGYHSEFIIEGLYPEAEVAANVVQKQVASNAQVVKAAAKNVGYAVQEAAIEIGKNVKQAARAMGGIAAEQVVVFKNYAADKGTQFVDKAQVFAQQAKASAQTAGAKVSEQAVKAKGFVQAQAAEVAAKAVTVAKHPLTAMGLYTATLAYLGYKFVEEKNKQNALEMAAAQTVEAAVEAQVTTPVVEQEGMLTAAYNKVKDAAKQAGTAIQNGYNSAATTVKQYSNDAYAYAKQMHTQYPYVLPATAAAAVVGTGYAVYQYNVAQHDQIEQN